MCCPIEIKSSRHLVLIAGALLIMGFLSGPCFAQFKFSGGVGMGTYAMTDLKNYNESIKTTLPVASQTISDFPPYATYEANLQYKIHRLHFGAYWSYNSTGSRLSYEDYSGTLWYNQKALSNQYGITLGYLLTQKEGPWEVTPSVRLGLISTNYRLNNYLQVTGSPALNEIFNFTSNSYMISPGIATTRVLNPRIALSFDLRYLHDFQKSLVSTSTPLSYLYGINGNHLSANWGGIRLTLSVEVRFPGKKS